MYLIIRNITSGFVQMFISLVLYFKEILQLTAYIIRPSLCIVIYISMCVLFDVLFNVFYPFMYLLFTFCVSSMFESCCSAGGNVQCACRLSCMHMNNFYYCNRAILFLSIFLYKSHCSTCLSGINTAQFKFSKIGKIVRPTISKENPA